MGLSFLADGHKVAVLPVDPSSHITGGSILGDKTRMNELSKSMQSFIRPLASRGALGGITENVPDIIFLCESARYDVIFIESVGVGQSEVEIDQAVDISILLLPPVAGDDLQASKKGILETIDLFVINKYDGELKQSAMKTKYDYLSQIQFNRRKYENWIPPVLLASSKTGDGILQIKENILQFKSIQIQNGYFERKRKYQQRYWMWAKFKSSLLVKALSDVSIQQAGDKLSASLDKGAMTPRAAAKELLKLY